MIVVHKPVHNKNGAGRLDRLVARRLASSSRRNSFRHLLTKSATNHGNTLKGNLPWPHSLDLGRREPCAPAPTLHPAKIMGEQIELHSIKLEPLLSLSFLWTLSGRSAALDLSFLVTCLVSSSSRSTSSPAFSPAFSSPSTSSIFRVHVFLSLLNLHIDILPHVFLHLSRATNRDSGRTKKVGHTSYDICVYHLDLACKINLPTTAICFSDIESILGSCCCR